MTICSAEISMGYFCMVASVPTITHSRRQIVYLPFLRTCLLSAIADLASEYIFADTVDKFLQSFVAYASSPAGSSVLPVNSYTLFVLDFGVAEQAYGYRGTFSGEHLLATAQDPRLINILNKNNRGNAKNRHAENKNKNNEKDTNGLHGGHKPEKNPDMSIYLNSTDANQLMTALQLLINTANNNQEQRRENTHEEALVRVLDLADISQRWVDHVTPGVSKGGDVAPKAVNVILDYIQDVDKSEYINTLRDMAEISPPGVARDALVRHLNQQDTQTTLTDEKSTPGVFHPQELATAEGDGVCAECLVDLWVGQHRCAGKEDVIHSFSFAHI